MCIYIYIYIYIYICIYIYIYIRMLTPGEAVRPLGPSASGKPAVQPAFFFKGN